MTAASARADAVLDALGDPMRRRIAEALRDGPRPVGLLAERMPIGRPAVSKHLRVLAESGLVRVEKSGRQRRYALDPSPLSQVESWLDRHRTAWAARLVVLKRQVEAGAQDASPGDPNREGT